MATVATLQNRVSRVSTEFASLDAAVAALGASSAVLTLAPGDTKTLTDDLTIPANVTLSGQMGVIATNGHTLTVNGPVTAGDWQVFDVSGGGAALLSGDSAEFISGRWFGAAQGASAATNRVALQAALDTGYESCIPVRLSVGEYQTDLPLVMRGRYTSQPDDTSRRGTKLCGVNGRSCKITKTTNDTLGAEYGDFAGIDAVLIVAPFGFDSANTPYWCSLEDISLGAAASNPIAYGLYASRLGHFTAHDVTIQAQDDFVAAVSIGVGFLTNWRQVRLAATDYGFQIRGGSTSTILDNVFVSHTSVRAYDLVGSYSVANACAADNCTGIIYAVTNGTWTFNSCGVESSNARYVYFGTQSGGSRTTMTINSPECVFFNPDGSVTTPAVFNAASNATLIVTGGRYVDLTHATFYRCGNNSRIHFIGVERPAEGTTSGAVSEDTLHTDPRDAYAHWSGPDEGYYVYSRNGTNEILVKSLTAPRASKEIIIDYNQAHADPRTWPAQQTFGTGSMIYSKAPQTDGAQGFYIRSGTSGGSATTNHDSTPFGQVVATTGNRPTPHASSRPGSQVFDTTLGQPIWHDGTEWVDATGTAA